MTDRTIDGVSTRFHHCARGPDEEVAVVRRGVVTFVFAFVVGLSGVATAGVFAGGGSPSGPPNDHETEATEQDGGVHGGPIDRFQKGAPCDLTAVSSLPGNWTHGDYVSAVAADGDSAQITEAAHSDCGKPMVSVGHGGGPPEHALEHMAAGKAHAGGNADGDESATEGS
jgi:hypothetical protein